MKLKSPLHSARDVLRDYAPLHGPHGLRQRPRPSHAPESPAADRNPRCAVSGLLNTTTTKERPEGQMLARRSVSDLSFAATSAMRLTFEEPAESRIRHWQRRGWVRLKVRLPKAQVAKLVEESHLRRPPLLLQPLTSHQPSAAPPHIGVGPREPHWTARTRRSGSPRIGGGDECGFSSENSSLHQQEVPQLTASSRGLRRRGRRRGLGT
ncbi:hypothetical protein QJS04_geneDACA009451 [Acorus gramineus]|uniref:Uncharacterized protein n=1 Tax=Acorus gramineus TaxID=55184 RepID=A0AAV9AK13_ACOGR|nr:hypothetical protein QJS04_geneDACA009451 [Acorus gramineus]